MSCAIRIQLLILQACFVIVFGGQLANLTFAQNENPDTSPDRAQERAVTPPIIMLDFDGDMEKVRLHVAVKTAQTRAGEWYRAISHYVAADLHRNFFPIVPRNTVRRAVRQGCPTGPTVGVAV